MLSQCANSHCGKPFVRLGEGKLFQVEAASRQAVSFASNLRKPPRRVDRYWLCNSCAATWTLVQDPKQGVSLLNLPIPPASVQPPGKTHPNEMA
jgi:hypothetical protein